jgi:hypothetical protein
MKATTNQAQTKRNKKKKREAEQEKQRGISNSRWKRGDHRSQRSRWQKKKGATHQRKTKQNSVRSMVHSTSQERIVT